jgi:pimeloyl-ACP methyl ester carboxylesterase
MPISVVDVGSIKYVLDGNGPPVLLLHSLGTSSSLWSGVITELRTTYTLIVPDLLGHGESTPPTRELSIPDHADSVATFLRNLGFHQVVVVGTSLGGLIALDLASRYPELVVRLVLNGCPGWHLESQRLARLQTISTRMIDEDGLVRPEVDGGGTVRPVSDEARRQRRLDLQRCGRWFLSSLWAVTAFDPISRLKSINAPTLVLMGDGDFHLSTSYALSAGIAGAVHRVVPSAGHLTPLDDPHSVAAELRQFINEAEVEDVFS